MAEAADELCSSPQPAQKSPRESAKGSKAGGDHLADQLAVDEQTHQELARVLEREEKKLNERRKHVGGNTTKSKRLVEDTLELNALKQFNDLRIEYQRRRSKNGKSKLSPSIEASVAISRRLGRSQYFARKLRQKLFYLHRVGELQMSKQGKGAAHQSLLSEPRVVAAIQMWVKGTVPKEEGGYDGRVSLVLTDGWRYPKIEQM